MPAAPEYSRKEQKRHAKARAEAARLEGTREDFPGAPIWNDWLQAQQEAKKRAVGRPRRLGRAIVENTAALIVAVKSQPTLTETRYASKLQKTKRLQAVVDRSHSAEAIPQTDLRMVEKSRLRRIGRAFTSAANRSNEKALQTANQQADHLSERVQAQRAVPTGPVESWARKKLNHIDRKRSAARQRRQDEYETVKAVAWEEYLDNNPEIKAQYEREQARAEKKRALEEASRYARVHQAEAFERAKFTIDYLYKDSGVSSFSKSIPRRPELPYDEVAKNSLETALHERQPDGTIPLFKPNLVTSTIDASDKSHNALLAQGRDRNDYVGGVATAIWKLGFVKYESDDAIPYGQGEYNPDIAWSDGDDGTRFASIPYNHDNELHRMIAGDVSDPAEARVQLEMNDRNYPPVLNVGLVHSPVAELA